MPFYAIGFQSQWDVVWAVGKRFALTVIIIIKMELISSVLSLVKNVSDKDREFKILKEKLVFHIRKGENVLEKYQKEHQVMNFIADNLEGRLRDASQRLVVVQGLLSNSSQDKQSISFKDKLKLSLPFNNERDRINQAIEDLRQATEEVLNSTLTPEPHPKRKPPSEAPSQPQIDAEIDQLYEMGPTIQENNALQFAIEFAKNQSVQVVVKTLGEQEILKVLGLENREAVVEKVCERSSRETEIELFQLGRMNFKKEYKQLRTIFPDVDKISKLAHFRLLWHRHITETSNSDPNDLNDKKPTAEPLSKDTAGTSAKKESASQRKEGSQQAEQFFSVPVGVPQQAMNGRVLLQKEKRALWRRQNEKWVKVEEERIEVTNGEEVAVCLNKELNAQIYFKINYRFK